MNDIASADSIRNRHGLYYVGKLNEAAFAVPHPFENHSRGYERVTVMDRTLGSVHMGVGVGRLQPQGYVDACRHANEKGIYLFEGELDLMRDGVAFHLRADDYALIPYGTPYALRNTGSTSARWFEMQAPQPKPAGGWQDTFFEPPYGWPDYVAAPDLANPETRMLGHFEARVPMVRQGEGINGLHVYRFMEKKFGAQHFFMMRGELAIGGKRGRHDHPVEEVYLGISGETDMDIEGERFHLGPGDVAWTGVGASHAFYQNGPGPFRWIETQAPQFPAQNFTRNFVEWEKLK